MANPLLVEDAGFTETPLLRPSLRHHAAASSSAAQQGVDQHLRTGFNVRRQRAAATCDVSLVLAGLKLTNVTPPSSG